MSWDEVQDNPGRQPTTPGETLFALGFLLGVMVLGFGIILTVLWITDCVHAAVFR